MLLSSTNNTCPSKLISSMISAFLVMVFRVSLLTTIDMKCSNCAGVKGCIIRGPFHRLLYLSCSALPTVSMIKPTWVPCSASSCNQRILSLNTPKLGISTIRCLGRELRDWAALMSIILAWLICITD